MLAKINNITNKEILDIYGILSTSEIISVRKLFILRGAMASGKSTFIRNNDFENFTLNSDKIRLMYNSPEMTINYNEMIPQFNNNKVWDLLFQILEDRMRKGELTFIDAMHIYAEDLSIYKNLSENKDISKYSIIEYDADDIV